MYYLIGGTLVGLVGVAFGVNCYWHLWRWARLIQGAQIAVSYKGKVKLVAALQEWALWCRNIEHGKENGRVVYHLGGTSVAVIRKREGARPKLPIRGWRRRRAAAPVVPRTKQGRWAAHDDREG